MSDAQMKTIKDMPREDYFVRGHGACPGCGVAVAVKNIARIIGSDATVYVPASCLIVFSSLYPTAAFKWPFLYTAFENTGAVISGIKAAYRRRGKETTVIGMAGDGGTFDIGLQALSGAGCSAPVVGSPPACRFLCVTGTPSAAETHTRRATSACPGALRKRRPYPRSNGLSGRDHAAPAASWPPPHGACALPG